MNKFLAENKQLIIRRFGLVVIDILSVALATYLGLIARFYHVYFQLYPR